MSLAVRAQLAAASWHILAHHTRLHGMAMDHSQIKQRIKYAYPGKMEEDAFGLKCKTLEGWRSSDVVFMDVQMCDSASCHRCVQIRWSRALPCSGLGKCENAAICGVS